MTVMANDVERGYIELNHVESCGDVLGCVKPGFVIVILDEVDSQGSEMASASVMMGEEEFLQVCATFAAIRKEVLRDRKRRERKAAQ
jgi:hypothetical protein